jgi:excinuclease UvrABC ATPase subunit
LVLLCSCGKKQVPEDTTSFKSKYFQRTYLELGQRITEQSFNTIRMHLVDRMSTDEISGAVQYCNVNIYPLTDSLNKEFNAKIRRTSLKWRNPKNAPNDDEKKILEIFEKLHSEGKKVNDSLIKINDTKIWYVKPIYAQGMCQNCHGGVGTTISEKNYNVIKKLYPEDKAIDYKSGDLRGMWSIKMNIKKVD